MKIKFNDYLKGIILLAILDSKEIDYILKLKINENVLMCKNINKISTDKEFEKVRSISGETSICNVDEFFFLESDSMKIYCKISDIKSFEFIIENENCTFNLFNFQKEDMI